MPSYPELDARKIVYKTFSPDELERRLREYYSHPNSSKTFTLVNVDGALAVQCGNTNVVYACTEECNLQAMISRVTTNVPGSD